MVEVGWDISNLAVLTIAGGAICETCCNPLPCEHCTPAATPSSIEVTISGLTDCDCHKVYGESAFCSDCGGLGTPCFIAANDLSTKYNGTFTINQIDFCVWECAMGSIPGPLAQGDSANCTVKDSACAANNGFITLGRGSNFLNLTGRWGTFQVFNLLASATDCITITSAVVQDSRYDSCYKQSGFSGPFLTGPMLDGGSFTLA